MRFLSYCLVFAFAFAFSVPTKVQAQQFDDDIIHVSAVSVPSIVGDRDNVVNYIDILDHHEDDDDGTINAPTLLHSQDELSPNNDAHSSIITTILTPMTVSAEASEEDDVDHSSDESFTIDGDDVHPLNEDDVRINELFARTDEELNEDGIDTLFETMAEANTNDNQNDVDAQDDVEVDDDDHSNFEISAAESASASDALSRAAASSHHKNRRAVRRPLRGKRLERMGRRFARYRPLKEKDEKKTMLKLLLLKKKLKALDMKMNLMKLISGAIKMRMQERMMRGLMQPLSLITLQRKIMKKLMLLKMIKLMHLVYDRMVGLEIYSPSGYRLSSRFLLRKFLRATLQYPSLAKTILRLKLKSLMMPTAMKFFAQKMKMLVKKLYLLKKASMGAENSHRLYVKADRAIVNVGDGNEFRPIFYRSRQGARRSIDDNRTPIRIVSAYTMN